MWTVRAAEREDIPALAALRSEANDDGWNTEAFQQEMTLAWSRMWVAVTSEHRVVGYLVAWRVEDDIDIIHLMTDRDHRRQGVASALLTRLKKEADADGVKRMTLEVRADNIPAQRLYQRFGFRQASVRRGYYKRDGADAWLMECLHHDRGE